MSPSPEAIRQVWMVSIGIYLVVVAVVAVMLTLILREARRILAGVSEIWNVGQKVANNTIHIKMLDETNVVAGRILAAVGGVAGATSALHAHAERCPRCPRCVTGTGGAS